MHAVWYLRFQSQATATSIRKSKHTSRRGGIFKAFGCVQIGLIAAVPWTAADNARGARVPGPIAQQPLLAKIPLSDDLNQPAASRWNQGSPADARPVAPGARECAAA